MPFFIEQNDITKVKCDAVVNAANSTLLGGGGVDGAIHLAAGPGLLAECKALGGCKPGEAKITNGYNLPAKFVIHTVGPIWEGGNSGEEKVLRACYANSLALAENNKCESVAFPLISSGAYGFPKEEAYKIACDEIRKFVADKDMTVKLILLSKVLCEENDDNKKLKEYIDRHYISFNLNSPPAVSAETSQHTRFFIRNKSKAARPEPEPDMITEEFVVGASESPVFAINNECCDALDDDFFKVDESYFDMLIRLIDASGMTDSECYHKANIDRKLFNKMKNTNYHPGKNVLTAFAFALRLDLATTDELLKKAGYALSDSFMFDVICKYHIENKKYNIFDVNEALSRYDQPLLGNIPA